jgi:succinate-semialdehyde dehydrogenase/glutarate-semialdehyde dehydrogenase
MLKLRDPTLMRTQAYVGGHWIDADSGALAPVHNPATGATLGTVPQLGGAETRRAIAAAHAN